MFIYKHKDFALVCASCSKHLMGKVGANQHPYWPVGTNRGACVACQNTTHFMSAIQKHGGGDVLRKNSAAHQAHHDHRQGDPIDSAEHVALGCQYPRELGRRLGREQIDHDNDVHPRLATHDGYLQCPPHRCSGWRCKFATLGRRRPG